jgi:hypothetical protein
MIGAIGRLQTPERQSEAPLAELSAAELDVEIERLARLANGVTKPRKARYRLL